MKSIIAKIIMTPSIIVWSIVIGFLETICTIKELYTKDWNQN